MAEKTCVICGEDCSGRPRVKDPKGRYACRACVEQQRERKSDAAAIRELLDDRADQPRGARPRPALVIAGLLGLGLAGLTLVLARMLAG